MCPTIIGYPSKRPRVLSFNLSRATLVWTGPTTPEDIRKDFLSIFERRTVADGDVYLAAADDLVIDLYRRCLSKKKTYIGTDTPLPFRGRAILQGFLPPGEVVRLLEYEEVFTAKHGAHPTKSYIVDLEL